MEGPVEATPPPMSEVIPFLDLCECPPAAEFGEVYGAGLSVKVYPRDLMQSSVVVIRAVLDFV